MEKRTLYYVKWAVSLASTLAAVLVFSQNTSLDDRPAGTYDEQMWTGASITAYNMFFTDYQRPEVQLDGWYAQYAQKYNVNLRQMGYEEAQWFDTPMWTFGWKAPNVGKYLMGGGIQLFADTMVNPEGYFYAPNPDKAKSKFPGNYAPASMLKIARNVNAFFSVLIIVTMLAIGWMFFGFWPGVLASVYLIANSAFAYSCTQVGLEATSIFFSTLCIFLTMLLCKRLYLWERNKMLLFATLTGLAFAGAVGSKLSGALLGFVLMVVYLFMLIKSLRMKAVVTPAMRPKEVEKVKAASNSEKMLRIKRIFLSGAVVAVVGIGTFIWLNPVFHDSPKLKMRIVRESVTDFFDIRARSQQDPSVAMNHDLGTSLWYILKRNGIYTGDVPSSRFYGTFGNRIPFVGNFLDFAFFVIGVLFLLKVRKDGQYSLRSPSFILLLSMFILVLGTADFMWIDWSRYHMPLYPTYALIIGVGIWRGGKFLVEKFSPKASAHPDTAT